MTTRFRSRTAAPPILLPLMLAACVGAEPAIATPAAPPLGVDLGGAPARHSVAGDRAAPSATNRAAPVASRRETVMAHDSQAGVHGTGTVTAVNPAQRRIGMQHDPIPAIGWPAMSMEFAVAPAVDLQGIQPGSRVDFAIEKGPDGMYVIQSIRPAGARR